MTAQRMMDKFSQLFPEMYGKIKKYTIPSNNSIVDLLLNDGTKAIFVYRNDGTWTLDGR